MSKIEVNQISSQCGSTLTIGQSGDTVTLASGATQTGFGRTGTVDWCTTAKTAPFTGVSGKGYFVNTTCGAVTVTLPATPTAGDIISIKDYARTFGINNITLCRNGSKMDGTCANGVINTTGESTTLIYVDGTKGWTSILDNTTAQYGAAYVTATGGTITTCGNYKIHTFTSDGCFSVLNAGNPAGSTTVDYLVVAGGGGSGGGGGGAGGYRESKCATTSGCWTASPLASATSLPVSVTTYPITVGAGGAAKTGSPYPSPGNNGTSSIFSTITSSGGGGSGGYETPGNPGGSGAGGTGGGTECAGSGNTPPVNPPQGNPGGATTGTGADAGGGGAGSPGSVGGTPTPPYTGGAGGAGVTTSISGSPTAYAGGGGGGSNSAGAGGAGGIGGGGDGISPTGGGTAGTANTGGGAGGATRACGIGAAGGSGIVIIRYKYQ